MGRADRAPIAGRSSPALHAAVAVALALPIALWRSRVLAAPAGPGLWRGLLSPPTPGRVVAALLLGALLAALLRHRPACVRRPLLMLLIAAAPLVPLFSGRLLPLLVFQGGGLLLVAAAALAVAVVRGLTLQPASPPLAAQRSRDGLRFALPFLFYAALGTRIPGPAGPQGDEPHYLVMAQSLLSDGDLDLRDEFAGREYAPFFAGTLQPHTSPRSPAGRLYAVHTPGLPALLLPGYAAAGYTGARLSMSALAALAALLVHRLLREATGRAGVADAGWAVFSFTPPFAFYAVALYPEVPAALATAVFLLLSRRDHGARGALLAAVAAAALPWIHPRLLLLAVLGLALVLFRRCPWLVRVAAALAFAASVALLLLFFRSHYGQASISAAYGPGFADDVSASRVPWGLGGLFLDRQFGLLSISPAWVLALAGAAALWRFRPGDAMRAALLAGSTLAAGASFSMWWGGACPPARFVIPALPALALALAPALPARRDAAAALAGIGLGIVALAADAPRALHNRADGESALLRLVAPTLDLDSGLPSFVLGGPQAPLLALTLLAVAALGFGRGGRGLALGAAAYAALAAGLHTGPLVERRLATLDVMESWDPALLAGPMGPPPLVEMNVPLDLPGAPWTVRSNDVRNSRRIDLPPGLYRLEAAARGLSAEPAARLARLDVVAGDLALASAYLREGQPITTLPLLLPAGARRMALIVSGAQGTAILEGARVVPEALVPAAQRDGFAWPRVPQPERYRVGAEGGVRVTCLDRSEPEAEGFRVDGPEGAFVVERPRGQEVVATVKRPRPAEGDAVLWAGQRLALGAGADVEVRLPPDAGVILGETAVTPARLLSYGAWITFSGAVGGTSATDASSASPAARPMVTVTSPPPESGK